MQLTNKTEPEIIEILNEGFKLLNLISLTDYAKAKGINPSALYKTPHKQKKIIINGHKFYKL